MMDFNNPDYDLIALGASTTLDGIDTEFLTENGLRSYNTAIDGCSVKTNYIQLREYLDKASNHKPKYVVLGLNSSMVISFDDELIQPIVETSMKNHHISLNDAPVLKFKWLGFELLKKIFSKAHRNAKMTLGQIKFKYSNPDNTNYKSQILNIDEFEKSFWIGELSLMCKQNGITLIVLEMPGYKATQNQSPLGPYKLNFDNGSCAYLLNFNSNDFCQIFTDDKDWIGNSHLNESGASKLTKEFLKIIKKKKIFEN